MIPFLIFLLLLSLPLAQAFARPEKIYEFPGFMAAAFAIFILPQAISLVRFPGAVPAEAVTRVLWMTCLCLGACLLGYFSGSKSSRSRRLDPALDARRLFHAGLVFVGCGFLFTRLLSRTEIQTSDLGGWTGLATIYAFFQQLCYPGFAICLLCALRRPTLLAIAATILAALVPLQNTFHGRREPAVLFLLTIGLTLFFQKKIRPPRWLIGVTLVTSMLAIPATATYRRFQLDQDWQAVQQINLLANFHDFLNSESPLELRNAAMLIEATRRAGQFEFGAGYWDHLVFRYVPAQWLGASFKESLMLQTSQTALETELAALNYTNPPGSTVTGIGDVYQQFGYFGCLFFAALGLAFRRLWSATGSGQPARKTRVVPVRWPNGLRVSQSANPPAANIHTLFAQLLYIQTCTSAMRAVTHWTLDFLPGFLYGAIFLSLAFWYARGATSSFGENGRQRRKRKLANAVRLQGKDTNRLPVP